MEKVVSCLICFEDYQAGDSVATLHCAGKHCFHKDCITKWLAKLRRWLVYWFVTVRQGS